MDPKIRLAAVATAAFVLAVPAFALEEEDAALRHARELLASTILVDGHNDLPG